MLLQLIRHVRFVAVAAREFDAIEPLGADCLAQAAAIEAQKHPEQEEEGAAAGANGLDPFASDAKL